jgi:hypothetical protein
MISRRAVFALIVLTCASACHDPDRFNRETTRPTYDTKTGRMTQLTYDANADGRIDTWIEMDGKRPIQSRIDRNQDGRIDRWEDYDAAGQLVRVGYSRADSGHPDAWAYPAANGRLERIEMSKSAEVRKIDRREFYDPRGLPDTSLIRAEEDTNADGRLDKWETYESGVLKTVAWDENGDGIADRRFTYRGSAPVLLESEPDTTGRFMNVIELR